jgi:hypothetical protein
VKLERRFASCLLAVLGGFCGSAGGEFPPPLETFPLIGAFHESDMSFGGKLRRALAFAGLCCGED